MNEELLNKNIQSFIQKNINEDINKLILKGSPFSKIKIQDIVKQIISKNKCRKKLPSWFDTKLIYYPDKVNIEQSSSEITASYKASLVSGKSLIDLTGGFGVDSYYFSKKIENVTQCEVNINLSKIADHNYKALNISNIKTISTDGINYLNKKKKCYDWIYADPSRRSKTKDKVFLLDESLPNIPKNLEILFEYTDNILLKLSPLLDIKATINELQFVKEIHVVSVINEVKELLFVLQKGYKNKIQIKTINFKKNTKQIFNSVFNSTVQPAFSLPKKYLYEPNASILKAGLFNEVSHDLNVYKAHSNSHLYTSDKIISFPGRRFEIIQNISFNKKQLKKIIPEKKANITIRNFPDTVANIRKKTGLKDGGEYYLFFTTNLDNKHIIIICSKI